MDSKSNKLIFVGYCESSKGYRLLDLKTKKIIKRRDVVFLENLQKYDSVYVACVTSSDPETPVEVKISPKEPTSIEDKNSSSDEYQSGDDVDDPSYIPQPSCSDTPSCNINLRPRKKAVKCAEEYGNDVNFFCPTLDFNEPHTFEEALSSAYADQWKTTMDE